MEVLAAPLVAFRSLNGLERKNVSVKVAIPRQMLDTLKWSNDRPVKIEAMSDGSIRLTQVNADEYDLVYVRQHWQPSTAR